MSRARHSSRDIEFDLPGALDDMAGLASKAAIGHTAMSGQHERRSTVY